MADKLRLYLESALSANEVFWTTMISKTSPEDQNELVVAASNIRSKMLESISCAQSLFETNMQCLAIILNLQKDKFEFEQRCQYDIQAIKGRMESLLAIVDSQQLTIEHQKKSLSLNSLWNKLLTANTNSHLNENTGMTSTIPDDQCSLVMSLLSSQCAEDIQRSQSNHSPEKGKSLILSILNKLNHIQSVVQSEVERLESENAKLRSVVNDKSMQLHIYSSREEETSSLLAEISRSGQELELTNRESSLRILQLEEEARRLQTLCASKDSEYNQLSARYELLQRQYKESCSMTEHWRTSSNYYRSVCHKDSSPLDTNANIQSFISTPLDITDDLILSSSSDLSNFDLRESSSLSLRSRDIESYASPPNLPLPIDIISSEERFRTPLQRTGDEDSSGLNRHIPKSRNTEETIPIYGRRADVVEHSKRRSSSGSIKKSRIIINNVDGIKDDAEEDRQPPPPPFPHPGETKNKYKHVASRHNEEAAPGSVRKGGVKNKQGSTSHTPPTPERVNSDLRTHRKVDNNVGIEDDANYRSYVLQEARDAIIAINAMRLS